MKASPPLSILLASLLTTTFPLHGAIVADFSGGNSADIVDGYAGKAGNGWANAWESRGYASSGSASASIGSISVVNEGTLWSGNHLKVTPSNNATGTGMAVGRNYGGEGGDVDLTKPIQITFQFSFDNLGTFLSSASNELFIGENNGNSRNRTSTTSWYLHGAGGSVENTVTPGDERSTPYRGQWNFSDGLNYIATGISIQEGVLYTFTLNIIPSTGAGVDSTYSVHLSNGTTSYEKSGLSFRSEQLLGRTIVFGQTYTSGQGATYSFGNIQIDSIPEPSTAALLFTTAAVGGTMIYRRRQQQKKQDV